MPEQQPKLVAHLVEAVGLVLAAAPDAQHVHIAGLGALQQVAHGGGGDARRNGVGGNPVGAHHGDVAAIDAAFETVVDLVFFDDPFQLAQADLAGGFFAIEGGGQLIERLRALPGRPPQLWVVDGEIVGDGIVARMHRDFVGDGLAIDGVLDFDHASGEGEEVGLDRQLDRMGAMGLIDLDAVLPGKAGFAQAHGAIDADRHQADAPVPAGVAGRLAHEIHVHALQPIGLVVLGERDREWVGIGAGLGDVGGDVELDAQRVVAGVDLAGDVDIVTDEGVLGFGDDFAIEQDSGDAVDLGQGQSQIAIDIGGGGEKRPLDVPGRAVDPHHRLFVFTEIGIGDGAGRQQRSMDVARQRDRRPERMAGRGQGEFAAELEQGRVRGSATSGGHRHFPSQRLLLRRPIFGRAIGA